MHFASLKVKYCKLVKYIKQEKNIYMVQLTKHFLSYDKVKLFTAAVKRTGNYSVKCIFEPRFYIIISYLFLLQSLAPPCCQRA